MLDGFQPGAGDGGAGEEGVEEGDDNVVAALEFEDAAFDALEGAFDDADAGALFEREVYEAAGVGRQVEDTAEVVHRFVGDDHQAAGGVVEKVVGREAALMNERQGLGLRGPHEQQAVENRLFHRAAPPAAGAYGRHEMLDAEGRQPVAHADLRAVPRPRHVPASLFAGVRSHDRND